MAGQPDYLKKSDAEKLQLRINELERLNKQIAKSYQKLNPATVDLNDVERLDMSVTLLSKRIAMDATTLGMDAPLAISDSEHRRTRMMMMEDLKGMLCINKALRELITWQRDEMRRRPQTFNNPTTASMDALADAKQALIGIGLDMDDVEDLESINDCKKDLPRKRT